MKLIRSYLLIIIAVLFVTNIIFAQAYNNPESAVYDAVNDRYLISNTGNGDIISVPRLNPSNLSYYKQGAAKSIRGLTISGTTLYAASTANDDSQVLLAIIMATGVVQKNITIIGGDFVNDVTADAAGNAYFSDNNNIYKFDPTTGTYTTLLANAGANGLLYDVANNRLLFTDDRPATGSAISAIDLATNNVTTLITNAGFQSLDGITVDHLGNYYVSCWSQPNQVYRYDSNFTPALTTVASTGHDGVPHNGVADIFYDQINDILVAPNMNANTVDFIPFAQLSTYNNEISIPTEFQLHQNFPNPFNPNTTIFYDVSKESNVKISVFDLLGRNIVTLVDQIESSGSKSINWEGRDFAGNLVNAGVYIYQIEVEGFIQTKKMVLLK